MSLIDPTGPELLERLVAGGWPISGEQLPELSASERQELERALLKIGARIFRSPERLDGWEEAYNAFAVAFQAHGAKLTRRQMRLDLPNMIFNYALKSGWIPHLVLVRDTPELADITSPKRVGPEAYCATSDHRGFVVVGTKQSIDWFHTRIQPAVLEWTAKAAEKQNCDEFREQIPETAGEEPPVLMADPEKITPVQAARQFKKAHELTWAKFAKRVHISETQLRQRVCNPDHDTHMSQENLQHLADELGCPWHYLNSPEKNRPLLLPRKRPE